MNIKELAKQARLTESNNDGIRIETGYLVEELTRFAELVAAHEREECAKVCELQDGAGLSNEHWWECAEAIRARSKP